MLAGLCAPGLIKKLALVLCVLMVSVCQSVLVWFRRSDSYRPWLGSQNTQVSNLHRAILNCATTRVPQVPEGAPETQDYNCWKKE